VPVALLRENNQVIGAELLAPHPLSRLGFIPHEGAAACLSLSGDDILTENNAPQVLSVGLPFLVAERASRNALARVVPNRAGFDRVLPVDGARSVYAYTRAAPDDSVDIYAAPSARGSARTRRPAVPPPRRLPSWPKSRSLPSANCASVLCRGGNGATQPAGRPGSQSAG